MIKAVLLVAVAFVAVADAKAKQLTAANFDEVVFNSGKSAFVKFLAPWWGHCKSMKPAWDKLGKKFKNSDSTVIADVDCTVEQDLCQTQGVEGYPTIKYYQGGEGEKYEGGRDFDALYAFAKDTLGPICGPTTKENCNEEQLAKLEEALALSDAEREEAISKLETEIEAAKQGHKDLLADLQAQFEKSKEQSEATVKELSPKLRVLKSAAPKKEAEKKDEL